MHRGRRRPGRHRAARSAGESVVAIASTFRREDLSDYDILIDDFTQITPEDIRNLKK